MATLLEIGHFWMTQAQSQSFERWLGACLKAAFNIINESAGTPNHANRLVWANLILSGDEANAKAKVYQMMKYAIASNATLQADPIGVSDGDIEFIVASQINIFAV